MSETAQNALRIAVGFILVLSVSLVYLSPSRPRQVILPKPELTENGLRK